MIVAIVLLTVSVQLRSRWQPQQRTRLYRVVEFVGRWSMLDIYVIAIIVSLVQLQALATITPGPGAIAFAAVVVLTMFAAMSFDPRLIWDPMEKKHGGTSNVARNSPAFRHAHAKPKSRWTFRSSG